VIDIVVREGEDKRVPCGLSEPWIVLGSGASVGWRMNGWPHPAVVRRDPDLTPRLGAHGMHRDGTFRRLRVSSYNSEALLVSNPKINMAIDRAAQAHAPQDAGRRATRSDRWDEDGDGAAGPAFKTLSREEAQVLRDKEPAVSPWRVIQAQAGVGAVAALLAVLFTGRPEWAWSLLYGAATVVVPGALMARGMTSPLTSTSPGNSAVSFMLWEVVKIAVSVAMLMLAPKIVQPLSWPALLVGLVLCMKVYWLALLWRHPSKN
jgi:ATP synthase protein I